MHKRLLRSFLLSCWCLAGWGLGLLLLGTGTAWAQQTQYTVTGRVIDAVTEQPLPGANVRFDNTTIGTAADIDGAFTLTANREAGPYDLVFSFIGYRPERRTVTLGSQRTVDVGTVALEEDIVRAEEIVVTGTSAPTARKQLGNAVSTVTARELEDTASPALDRALQGKIAGAYVQQNSGNPAGGISVRLRGTGTVLGDADPLYIIDGVIVDNSSPILIDLGGGAQNRLVDINPADIERIEIVKGAAAAAIYGSRANNGVVQIFTKRGQQGVPRVTFSTRLQTDAVRKTLDVNMATNDQGQFIGNNGEPLVNEDGSPGQRYDFQDFIFDRAYGTEQYLSVSGGASGTNYFLSGSHFVNEGIVKGNLFRRLNGRVRVGQTLSDWANVSAGASFTRSKSDDVPNGGLTSNYGSLTGFIFGPNTFDPRPDEFGRYPNLGILANPIEVIDQYDFTQETRRFIGDVQLGLTPLEGFGLDYTLGFDTYGQESIAFIPRGTSAPGLGTGQSRRATLGFLQLNNDLNLRYQANLSESIASTTLLGGTMQYEQVESFSGQSQNLTPIAEVVNSGTSSIIIGESRSERVIYGVFAQETIGLGERLFLTATGRFDASSVFGEDERWQFYPKASASYLISEENFWQNGSLGRYVPSFKLRGAIGTSGGLTAIGAFDRFTNYFPQSYGGNPGLQPSSVLGATDIKPERQREIEVGADLGLLNNRLAIEFTYYDQRTTDLLLTRQVAPSSGFLTRLENTGVLENKGIELLVRAVPINQRAFRWNSSITYARNRNKVTGLVEEENPEGILILGGFGLVGAVEGQPLGVFYGSAYRRQNQDLDSPLLEDGPIVDADGNVLEDLEAGIPARSGRSKIIGDPNPDFTASWINEFTIRNNLSVRAQVDAVVGQDVFNFTRRLAALGAFGTLTDFERELEGDLPAGYNGATFSTFERWVEDGSFVKLRELSIAYTLYPPSATLRSVRLSLVGRNLFSIDDYSGYDPEVNVAGQRSNIRNFDFVEVPIPRTFSFGVTLGF